MAVMTFQGTVENGQVRLATDVHLPEKTKVYVVVPEFEEGETRKKFDLSELISRMPPGYAVCEESFGEPVGKEEW